MGALDAPAYPHGIGAIGMVCSGPQDTDLALHT